MANETQRFQLELNLTKEQLEQLFKFISDKDIEILTMKRIGLINLYNTYTFKNDTGLIFDLLS